MKQQFNLKNTMGLTQEETGMLLGVSRAQCSMFVSGKRDLPLEAKTQLVKVLQYLKAEEKISEERQQFDKAEAEKTLLKLEQDYKGVLIKLYRITKKINILENTRNDCFTALRVASFLETQEEKLIIEGLDKFIRNRAKNSLQEHNLHKLIDLQLKKESFEVLKTNIEKKLKSL